MPKLITAEMSTPPDTVGPQDLIEAAQNVYDNAYAPYSRFAVGAALDFAERHGGHLVTLTDKSVLNWITSKIPENKFPRMNFNRRT